VKNPDVNAERRRPPSEGWNRYAKTVMGLTGAPDGVSTLGLMGADAGTRVVAVAARWSHEPDPPLALAWDPSSDTWSELATPSLAHRFGAAVAWTGTELLIWGGANTGGLGGPSHADGAALSI
jgi:hypothetical protein